MNAVNSQGSYQKMIEIGDYVTPLEQGSYIGKPFKVIAIDLPFLSVESVPYNRYCAIQIFDLRKDAITIVSRQYAESFIRNED